MPTATYTQHVKGQVRRRVLEQAVATLTTGRDHAPVVRSDEFRETLEYTAVFLRQFAVSQGWVKDLESEAEQWMDFYSTEVGRRVPRDLKVLYLCGPEPINDLEVLLSLGIIPQNIWAIENQNNLYRGAIDQLKQHGSYIRVHHGNLKRFFDTVNERFDIVYMDACGPLPSASPNTLGLPIAMAQHERLATLGVLITNFAEPNSAHYGRYVDLMTQYFSPRYNDYPRVLTNEGVDPYVAHADIEYLKRYVSKHVTAVYSDFVTRFLVDLVRNIIPQRRIVSNSELRRKYFADPQKLAQVQRQATASGEFDTGMTPKETLRAFIQSAGDFYLNPSSYPIATFFQRVAALPNLRPLLAPLLDDKLDGTRPEDALLTVGLIEQMIEGHWEAVSPEMLAAIRESWIDADVRIFCDRPMPNLLVNSLFGIYSRPYFPNPRGSLRISYVAKDTRMYTDCLLLDQCRYYFDFWPTIDLIPHRFRSPEFQLILRICLDRMGRHDWNSSSHPFRGAALGGLGEFPSATQYEFSERLDAGTC
jgi:hypothetical protein